MATFAIENVHLLMKPKSWIKAVALALSALLPDAGLSQPSNFHLQTFPLMGQLPSGYVKFAQQDHLGLMWFGTEDGLCRYDGYQLFTYRANNANPHLLSSNNVLCMAECGDLTLIGTDAGLNILDQKTNTIRRTGFADLDNYEIRAIVPDKEGNIWVGTYKRLVRLSADLKECKRYDSRGVPVTSVNSVYLDRGGNLWVMYWKQGLYRYDPKRDRFERMPRVGITDNPFRLFQDKDGRYWLSSWTEGVYAMHPATVGHHSTATYLPVNPSTNGNGGATNYFSIAQDRTCGYLWMVDSYGLTVARPGNDMLQPVNTASLQTQMNDVLESVFCDRDGNIWLTGLNSLFFVNMNVLSIFNFPFSSLGLNYGDKPVLRAVCVDADGNIWSSQMRRGLIYLARGRQPVLFSAIPSLAKLKSLVDLSIIAPSPAGVWVMPEYDSHIYLLSAKDGKPKVEASFDLGADNFARATHEDSQHTLWIATTMGVVAIPQGQKPQALTGNLPTDVRSLTTDSQGQLWLASQWSGLYAYNVDWQGGHVQLSQTVHLTHDSSSLPTDHITSITADRKRNLLWIATAEGGVFTYDWKTGRLADYSSYFTSYIGTRLLNIAVDRYGMVWLNTNRSLLRFQPNDHTVTELNHADDIAVMQYMPNAFYYDGQNSLYVGGYGGLTRIDIRHATYKSGLKNAPIVSDVKVNAESVLNGAQAGGSIDQQRRLIVLDSHASNIEIDFTTCDYAHPRKIIYGYQLEGVDQEMRQTTTTRHYAFYNHLPSGTFKLVVKALDANGNLIGQTTVYKLRRQPAFYETWWARLLYVAVAVAIIFGIFYRYRRRQLMKLRMAKLEMEYEKEEELTKTKLQYFTNISHDFLTPITIISCIIDDIFITTPEKDSQSRNLISQLDRIKVNLRRLKRLIQQVLDFRKIESGKMSLEVQKGDMVQFIRDIYNDYFEPLLRKKDISFVFDTLMQQMPAYFDPDKLERILINLLSNAYKYTDKGEIRIQLRQVDINSRHYAVISVSDTGTGISPKNLPHIFERFFTSEHHVKESNGIGLALVHDLVQLHHGTIKAESVEGQGSTFTLQLPIDKQSYNEQELHLSKEISQVSDIELDTPSTIIKETDGGVSGGKMLIVEDNAELLSLMGKIFSRYHHVSTATNGAEALEAVAADQPDIIISDVMMPVMDGLEMCRQLKQNPDTSHIPIILLTARTNPEDRIECYNAGADGYITKPFELSVLKARIDNFLRDKNLQQTTQAKEEEYNVEKLKLSDMDKHVMQKAIDLIESHIGEEQLDVNFLADKLCMSNSTLYRKIKGITGLSPVAFIRNVRLKYAYRQIANTDKSITDIAYDCGFSTRSYFSTCFKTEFGISPQQVRMGKE